MSFLVFFESNWSREIWYLGSQAPMHMRCVTRFGTSSTILKNVKNTQRGVLLLAKLLSEVFH